MKKLLSLTVTLFAIIIFNNYTASAQITITQADFAVIGDTVLNANDTMPVASIMVGGAGSQTWDFSALQVHAIDTTYFVDPASTGFASDFPTATIATDQGGFFGFLNVSSTEVIFEGFAVVTPPLAAKFNPTQKMMEFPNTDGAYFQDTSAYRLTFSGAQFGIDSIALSHGSQVTYSVDGYGMVTTPAGTYDAIRGLTMDITVDSIFAKDPILTGGVWVLVDPGILGAPNPEFDTIYTYRWLANGMGSPVAEVVTDIPGGNAITASYMIGNSFAALFTSDVSTKCKGDCDAQATATLVNGVGPFTYSWNTSPLQTTSMATGLCGGIVTVTIMDSNNDTAYASLNISEPLIAMSLTATSVNQSCDTCLDATATVLVFGGDPAFTYLWDDPASQTTQTATGLNPGNYMVTVTDGNGCVKSIADTVNVGIGEVLVKPLNLKIYPNPTSGSIAISMDADIDFVQVYDAKGQLLMVEEVNGPRHTIDISDYRDGLYFLRLMNRDIVITKKVFLVR